MDKNNIRTGLIVMLDMLGFKERSTQMRDFIKVWQEFKQEVDKEVVALKKGFDIEAGTLFLSDTILICLWSNNEESLKNLLCGVPELIHSIYRTLIINESKIFLRGAMSYGEFLLDLEENIVMGPALNEAAEWYESTDWIGVILTPSAEFALRSIIEDHKDTILDNTYIEYNIPFKVGFPRLCNYAVLWCLDRNNSGVLVYPDLLKIFSKVPHSPRYSSKYVNTLKFIKEANKIHDRLQD